MLNDSAFIQSIEELLKELSAFEEEEAKAFLSEIVQMARMKKMAYAGYRPTFPVFYTGMYEVQFSPTVGSEQALLRPAIVLWTTKNSSVAVVIPVTGECWQDKYYFHVDLEHTKTAIPSTALLEQIRTVSKARFVRPINIRGNILTVNERDMLKIKTALAKFYRL